ncbi:hypothetical protein HOG21_07690 [bacterium]|nr:hypothetical protein [bacterium]
MLYPGTGINRVAVVHKLILSVFDHTSITDIISFSDFKALASDSHIIVGGIISHV